MRFLIEPDVQTKDVEERLISSIRDLGHDFVYLDNTNGLAQRTKPPQRVSGKEIFFGSLGAIKELRKWINPPVMWCDWETLCCHTYYAHYGRFLLNQVYGFYPLIELPRLRETLYKLYAHKNKILIRPDTSDKIFSGEVVGEPQFDYWFKMANFYEPKPTQLCVVAKPSEIESEFRFIIVNGKVATGCKYRHAGMMVSEPYDKKAADLAKEIADVWQPHPAFVMDIAKTYTNEYKLIEIGPINGADFYACDVRAIVQAMEIM